MVLLRLLPRWAELLFPAILKLRNIRQKKKPLGFPRKTISLLYPKDHLLRARHTQSRCAQVPRKLKQAWLQNSVKDSEIKNTGVQLFSHLCLLFFSFKVLVCPFPCDRKNAPIGSCNAEAWSSCVYSTAVRAGGLPSACSKRLFRMGRRVIQGSAVAQGRRRVLNRVP